MKEKKNEILLSQKENVEMEDFNEYITESVHLSEKKDKAFSSWIFRL